MRRNGSSGAPTTALLLVSALLLLLTPSANGETKFRTLYKFKGGSDASGPQAGLVFDSAGNLYGTTIYGGAQKSGTVFKLTRHSHGKWTESVLYSFCSLLHCTDGSAPTASLVFDSSGNLYGTTTGGGANYANEYAGTIFELTAGSDGKWTESVLYSFCALQNCADGSLPQAALVFDNNGTLYGTTRLGGASNRGTAFQLAPQQGGGWTEGVIYSFCSGCGNGEIPTAPLIFDAIGNLYGTTFYPDGTTYGTVFELSPGSGGTWSESVLYSFPNPTDTGGEPWAGLAFDQAGDLYGTAWGAGKPGCNSYGCGGVFQLTPNGTGGWDETTLYLFTGGVDGSTPLAGVTLDSSGNVYGTTAGGGAQTGVVYKLAYESGGWNYRILHTFGADGDPQAGLILDGAGSLYGTTFGNQNVNHGSVFKLTP
jgi:uncharacterized repeat protein (TIGR03803 family)